MVRRESRETISSPLSNLKLWNSRCGESPTIFTIAKVVIDLLWFAPHTKTISIKYVNANEFSFEFTYKKPLIYEGETARCCKSLPISCWHHCMEAVKVEFKEGRSNIIRYTLKGTDIWEKIVALSEVWQRMKSA
ncbi:hypothetical protein Dsin_030962 [Dipteronia sinensis]|uniref:Uncharacterized protein n=1 Tax=Dipteronia sinensis TaxID=43782 RepID=A0AAE0DRM7_9ROSI|nr:hypothetical protein Dsin_030962 [Dipteronia sinensis]